MEKSTILIHLRKFIETKQNENVDRRTAKLYDALKKVNENCISIGAEPTYFFARLECNSTGVGTSSFGGTETQRTVALDYMTDETVFIDGHIGAGEKGLSIFYLKGNQTIIYYKKSDVDKAAFAYGYQLHRQNFSDLNFRLQEHRVNRYKAHMTKKPFTYPIRPVFARLEGGDKDITIGYVYVKDGLEYILIEPQEPKGDMDLLGCAWSLFSGVLLMPLAFCFSLFGGKNSKKKKDK